MEQAWRKGQMEIKGIKIADDSRGSVKREGASS
jgi:hypothetical protein